MFGLFFVILLWLIIWYDMFGVIIFYFLVGECIQVDGQVEFLVWLVNCLDFYD